VPPAAALTDATVIRIGQLVGAGKVILGTLELDQDTLVVRSRSVALESGRVVTQLTVRSSLEELFQTFERIAHQISPPPKAAAEIKPQRPPLAGFQLTRPGRGAPAFWPASRSSVSSSTMRRSRPSACWRTFKRRRQC
jgi:hypothetical protein